MNTESKKNPVEIRIGVIGSVNSGKSTFIGVAKSGKLDNGNGSARSTILRHPHEKERGQTSCLSHQHILLPDKGKYFTFVDMAGHEKYLKTTMHGLVGQDLDYVIIMVGTNMGITNMTKEHIIAATSLNIPVIIILTKIDICPEHMLKSTFGQLRDFFKKKAMNRVMFYGVKNEKHLESIKSNFNKTNSICPYFFVSNKSGDGLELLFDFIYSLEPRLNWQKHCDKKLLFKISEPYSVTGVGKVVSGKVIRGSIKKGDQVLIGPFGGEWKKIIAKSLHNDFKEEIDEIRTGESGCIAMRIKDKDFELKDKRMIRKGMVIIGENSYGSSYKFIGDVFIFASHQTTIAINYQPIINVGTVAQSAKITHFDDVESTTKDGNLVLRGGDRAKITFEFVYNPEVIHVGQLFMFREGNTRGVGKIIEVL
jgi:small GTP-binding protein